MPPSASPTPDQKGTASPTTASPALAGLSGKCPRCGRGPLFRCGLVPRGHCPNCDLDYAFIDTGDGPAVFAIFILGFMMLGLAWHRGIPVPRAGCSMLSPGAYSRRCLVSVCCGCWKPPIGLQYRNKAELGQLALEIALGMLHRWQKAGLILPLVAAVLALAILVGLGTWQLQRSLGKNSCSRTSPRASPPVAVGDRIFDSGPSRLPAYTKVTLSGRFLHGKERYWFADGRLGSGFEVFTPLDTAPSRIVWIDRGYVPVDRRDPATRTPGQLDGVVTVTGLVHISGERNRFTPPNDPAHNVWSSARRARADLVRLPRRRRRRSGNG